MNLKLAIYITCAMSALLGYVIASIVASLLNLLFWLSLGLVLVLAFDRARRTIPAVTGYILVIARKIAGLFGRKPVERQHIWINI